MSVSGKSIAIIGLGPAGCICLASLPHTIFTDWSVYAFESGCIGGDLSRLYGSVVANLTRAEMESAFRKVPAWSSITEFPHLTKYSLEQCPLLSDVCKQLRESVAPCLTKISLRMCKVKSIQQQGSGGWIIRSTNDTLEVDKVILCTGADPIQFDLPKSTIPLDVALSRAALAAFLPSSASVVVYGTSHSGTLILRNLKDCGIRSVTAIYKGHRPFRWFRDGDTEGLKQESAVIADEITKAAWGPLTPTLIALDRTDAVIRHTMNAEYIVYAIGFQTRCPKLLDVSGADLNCDVYDRTTGAIGGSAGFLNLWGFGIGYPSQYITNTGTPASDIGLGGFADHIQANISSILR